MAQRLKSLPGIQETRVWSLGQEDTLEKETATHSSTLAWRIPWREEPGRLQSMGSQRVGHHWATSLSLTRKRVSVHLFINKAIFTFKNRTSFLTKGQKPIRLFSSTLQQMSCCYHTFEVALICWYKIQRGNYKWILTCHINF